MSLLNDMTMIFMPNKSLLVLTLTCKKRYKSFPVMSVTDKPITTTWYCCSLQISSCHTPPPSTHTTPKKRIATSCWTVVHIACSQRRSSLKLTAYLSKWTRLVDEVKHLLSPFFSLASLKGWQTELGQKSRWPLDLRFARQPHIYSSLFGCDIFSLV